MKHKVSIKTFNNGVLSLSEFKDAKLSTKDVVGIVLQTETIGLILAPPVWKEPWGDDKICVEVQDEYNFIDEAVALSELSGLQLTKNIIEANKDFHGMFAAKRCFEYERAGLQWYMPCLYELSMLAAYKNEINEVLVNLRMPEAQLGQEWNWCSSEYKINGSWAINFLTGNYGVGGKFCLGAVRAVSFYEKL
jgi:hypothetical protein